MIGIKREKQGVMGSNEETDAEALRNGTTHDLHPRSASPAKSVVDSVKYSSLNRPSSKNNFALLVQNVSGSGILHEDEGIQIGILYLLL